MTKTAKIVTKILQLLSTHFVSNIRRQDRCSQIRKTSLSENSSFEYFLHLNRYPPILTISMMPIDFWNQLSLSDRTDSDSSLAVCFFKLVHTGLSKSGLMSETSTSRSYAVIQCHCIFAIFSVTSFFKILYFVIFCFL